MYKLFNQMKTNTISITYHLKWRFKDYPHLQVADDKKTIFNTKTNRKRRLVVNGGYSIGFWITPKKFVTKKELNNYIELIPKPKEILPF